MPLERRDAARDARGCGAHHPGAVSRHDHLGAAQSARRDADRDEGRAYGRLLGAPAPAPIVKPEVGGRRAVMPKARSRRSRRRQPYSVEAFGVARGPTKRSVEIKKGEGGGRMIRGMARIR